MSSEDESIDSTTEHEFQTKRKIIRNKPFNPNVIDELHNKFKNIKMANDKLEKEELPPPLPIKKQKPKKMPPKPMHLKNSIINIEKTETPPPLPPKKNKKNISEYDTPVNNTNHPKPNVKIERNQERNDFQKEYIILKNVLNENLESKKSNDDDFCKCEFPDYKKETTSQLLNGFQISDKDLRPSPPMNINEDLIKERNSISQPEITKKVNMDFKDTENRDSNEIQENRNSAFEEYLKKFNFLENQGESSIQLDENENELLKEIEKKIVYPEPMRLFEFNYPKFDFTFHSTQFEKEIEDVYSEILEKYNKSFAEEVLSKFREEGKTARNNLNQREQKLKELIITEKNYIKDLEYTVETFMKTIFDSNIVPDELKTNRTLIFRNIEEIYIFHKDTFSKRLNECVINPLKFNDVFQDLYQFFNRYLVYLRKQYMMNFLLKNYMNVVDELFINHSKMNKSIKRLDTYLNLPFQRLIAYKEIVSKILQYTRNTFLNDQEKVLEHTYQIITDLLSDVNDVIAVNGIQGYDDLSRDDHKINDEFLVSIKSLKTTRRYHLFLFTSLLLITEKEEQKTLTNYIIKYKIDISQVTVETVSAKNENHIIIKTLVDEFRVYSKDTKIIEKWETILKKEINEYDNLMKSLVNPQTLNLL